MCLILYGLQAASIDGSSQYLDNTLVAMWSTRWLILDYWPDIGLDSTDTWPTLDWYIGRYVNQGIAYYIDHMLVTCWWYVGVLSLK